MKRIYYIILAFSLIGTELLYAQENPVGNISSLPYFLNPSFYAMNDLGKVGFVYQSEMQNIGSQEERRLVFGSYNFQEGGFFTSEESFQIWIFRAREGRGKKSI